jgi:hypothetical protein
VGAPADPDIFWRSMIKELEEKRGKEYIDGLRGFEEF